MIIQKMFADDINRKINGVIKVDQDANEIVEQEVREYIITRELRKHFSTFFNFYSDSFDNPTADIGVWISGFFGSGKSHFLKMLSYLLENKPVGDTTTVELFRQKFADDPATFMQIDRATRSRTESILFNIDIESSINKDKTAVLRVFAKMFYNHLGFYGENLKVAMLEYYIEQCGKTEEFRRVFEEKRGKSWVEMRRGFTFNGRTIIPTLMEVLDMSEEDASKWFHDKTAADLSIAQLVGDIKDYVDRQPKDFRLLFMIDEVGQYVGTDTDMLLNLQSIVEKLGSECGGRVWVICTGQEAIDEIIKVRVDEFSRIQARFATRLSLSSSSVDEVIQKRILRKTPEAEKLLSAVYDRSDSTLRNLFTFREAQLDIKGYSTPFDFTADYPFVPYQFIIIQKVFAEIRRHGNSGKHLSGGERSMLSGFQEAAQKVQHQGENTLVPFYYFYDTVHEFLDGSIRRVIDRCERAAEAGDGLKATDVNLLKLLYLIRYIDHDVPANLDNLVILMADDIRVDKIVLRAATQESLDRLLSQNYIGRSGDVYNFLTDEEQDIQRAIINETPVSTHEIVSTIAGTVFGDIYPFKKYHYGEYDFPFDQMVDAVSVGALSGGMRLKFLTVATDATEKNATRLQMASKGQAIGVLAETDYYNSLEHAMKIRKYVKQRNVRNLPLTVQHIIEERQAEAARLEGDSKEELKKAIVDAEFYVDGERLDIRTKDARDKIDQALEYLVNHVYTKLELIRKNAKSDADILAILNGTDTYLPGTAPNQEAENLIDEYLEIQHRKSLPTSMADIQSHYQGIPYGWKEIDIAAVVARLIVDQKVTIKYAGATVQPGDPRLLDMLRKKSEIGKTMVSKRQSVSALQMREARDFLREYFDVMDVPDDEDGLIAFIIDRLGRQKSHYEELLNRYEDNKNYPDRALVKGSLNLIEDVLSQQKDNIALIARLNEKADDLADTKDEMQRVENFFQNQVAVFDAAVRMERNLHNDLEYLPKEPEANEALNRIRIICRPGTAGKFDYRRIPELNSLMVKVKEGHDRLLTAKRAELLEDVRQCMEAIHTAASGNGDAQKISDTADHFYAQKREQIQDLRSLALLDGLLYPMLQYKDDTLERIEAVARPVPPTPPVSPTVQPPVNKVYKTLNRSIVFPAKKLESEEDIDLYVAKVGESLKKMLKNCDGIQLK